MRVINWIIYHCSASNDPADDSIDRIRELHTANRSKKFKWGKYVTTGKGFVDIGYHFVITSDGSIHSGRPIHKPGAHCKKYNHNSIGICLTGYNRFTKAQMYSLRALLIELVDELGLTFSAVRPHNYFNRNKSCPNFDIVDEFRALTED